MKPIRVTGSDIAVLGDQVNKLIRKFEYPDDLGPTVPFTGGGGGGMAHILIVSTSEPEDVQEKADFVVSADNSSGQVQAIFDAVDGPISIWMAGVFTWTTDVTAPAGALIRGLGYTGGGVAA